MKVDNLIELFLQPHENCFHIKGPYGYMQICPDDAPSMKNLYLIDCCYMRHGKKCQIKETGNFRLSTACCISVCIMYGESALNDQMIEKINARLD